MEISNCWVKTADNGRDKSVKLNPLPNALMKKTKFIALNTGKNEYLNHFYHQAQGDLKEMTNYNFEVTFSPVWHKSEYKRIWSSVYKQAEILNIYFCFFIERSLNVLIRKYNSSLVGDSFSNENLDSELSDHSVSPTSSIFSSKDLVLLTRISYFYYGDLIKAIRKSLTKINVEYTTKISMFSCWSTFLQLHGSVETLCLMLSGTTSLLVKIVNEVNSYAQITPSIKFCLNLVNDHSLFCLVPDYNFSVVEELYHDITSFKLFCYNNQELTSLSYSMLVLLLLKLEHFMKNLIHIHYPKIKSINDYYKYLNNIQDESSNIYCTSFTLLYELLVEWFDLYPSEKMSMNSRMSPLKKVFYLFFSAIGKTVINVISPIRAFVGVDLCDMFFPNIETDFSVYMFEKGLLTDAQYQYLSTQSTKLFRCVNFFNNRIALYAYHLANGTVMDKEYLQLYKGTSNVTEYKDTIRILPQKMKVKEVMLEKFSDLNLRYCNYPNFDIFSEPNFSKYTTDPEEMDIKEAISNVDLKTGLLPKDFDANPLVEEYRKVAYDIWKSSEPTIEDWRQRIHNLHMGRTEISQGVKVNLYGEPPNDLK